MYRLLCVAAAVALSTMSLMNWPVVKAKDSTYGVGAVSENGAIRVPENFRSEYVMLGAWSVAGDADTGGEIGFHIVYAPRQAVESYKKQG
ncbi:MAG: hypothetical protein R3245_06395, partial [Kiloniellales bacterium]|nr:hypothetical protein [Kiloniellales bacterium]